MVAGQSFGSLTVKWLLPTIAHFDARNCAHESETNQR
jgi:hypothetical protein